MALLGLISIFAIWGTAIGCSVVSKMDGRITGGENARIEDHPYQLSFGYFGQHICGAVLIRPNIALVAAQCTDGIRETHLTVRAGTSERESGGELANIRKICQHVLHNGIDYDISVLVLDKYLEQTERLYAIGMRNIGEEVPVGVFATVTGWGMVSANGDYSPVLQKIRVPRISYEDCAKSYPENTLTSRMVCYGSPSGKESPCLGDLGSPAVVGGKLVGLVSWGDGCDTTVRPAVYVNLLNQNIRDTIEDCIQNM